MLSLFVSPSLSLSPFLSLSLSLSLSLYLYFCSLLSFPISFYLSNYVSVHLCYTSLSLYLSTSLFIFLYLSFGLFYYQWIVLQLFLSLPSPPGKVSRSENNWWQ